MFDISFSELMVIAVVALVVIGPEKLPKVARTAGAFFGRMQRFVAQVKDEVNREIRFQELQQLQEEVKSSLQQGVDEVSHSIAALPEAAPAPVEAVSATRPRTRKPRTSDMSASVTPTAVRKRRNKVAAPEAVEAVESPSVGAAGKARTTRKKSLPAA